MNSTHVFRYELWLRGADIGPHPEDNRQTAAPMPSQMDLLCNNSQLPEGYLSAVSTKQNKRHKVHHKKKTKQDSDLQDILNSGDIPVEVQKVLQDLENEETSEPDEQQLEVLEDIWLKAGEMGKNCKTPFLYLFFKFWMKHLLFDFLMRFQWWERLILIWF